MCFIVCEDFGEPVEAKQEIPIYKRVSLYPVISDGIPEVQIMSLYEKFPYKLGILHTCKIGSPRTWADRVAIYEGFHGFLSLTSVPVSVDDIRRRFIERNGKVVKGAFIPVDCLACIPAGATFYINPYLWETVSNQIILRFILLRVKQGSYPSSMARYAIDEVAGMVFDL